MNSQPAAVMASPVQGDVPTAALRITVVVTSVRGGGAEAVGVSWIRGLMDLGHDVDVVVVSDTPIDDEFRSRVNVTEIGRIRRHRRKVQALRAHIARRKSDVLLALQTYPNLMALAAAGRRSRRKTAVVVTEHNLITLGLPGSRLSHRVKIALAKRWYQDADAVTSCSHPVAAEMVSGFRVAGDRSFVVPNPAMAKVGDRKRVARTVGVADGVTIVMACRLVKQKNPALAISVAAALNKRGVPTTVESFGGGPLLAALMQAAEAAGVELITHGWVDDWFAQFPSNAVVLLPSFREGFGNVLVEAAARGVPGVGLSNALGVADAIIPGVTGALSLTSDPEDVADAVIAASHASCDGIDAWLDRFGQAQSSATLSLVLVNAVSKLNGGYEVVTT